MARAVRCRSLPAPIAIIDHSTGPASGRVKKPALLSAISQSYLPLTELPLSTLASPAPSSPVDTEKRARKQLHSGKTAVAAFQEAELWHEDKEEAKNTLLLSTISKGRIIITIMTPIIMLIEIVGPHFYHKLFLCTTSESSLPVQRMPGHPEAVCLGTLDRDLKCSLSGCTRVSIQV